MQRKCVICGIEVEENAPVCPKCGTLKPTEAPKIVVLPPKKEKHQSPEESTTPEEPTSQFPGWVKTKLLPAVIGAAVLLLLIILVGRNLYGPAAPRQTTPPKAPTTPADTSVAVLDQYFALSNGAVDILEQMAPPEYWDYMAQSENMTRTQYLEMLKSQRIAAREALIRENGSYTIGGSIQYSGDLPSDALPRIASFLNEKYGIDPSTVTSGQELLVYRKMTTENGKQTLPYLTVYRISIGGKWYLITYEVRANTTNITFVY